MARIKGIITAGDPHGIGYRLLLEALRAGLLDGWQVIGSKDVLQALADRLGYALPPIPDGWIDVPYLGTWQPGTVSADAGAHSFACLVIGWARAVAQALPIITLPIHKQAWHQAGIIYVGHTEFFRQWMRAYQGDEDKDPRLLMTMSDPEQGLTVAALTDHIPLKHLYYELLDREWWKETVLVALENLTTFLNRKREDLRVAMMGLNPHAGEEGLIGHEEVETMIPVIEEIQQEGWHIEGPFPADSFWGRAQWRHYDAVLAPYHDQAFVPFKILTEGVRGVHTTLGLPVLRLSPVHGTAFEAVLADQVHTDSFLTCLKLAERSVSNARG